MTSGNVMNRKEALEAVRNKVQKEKEKVERVVPAKNLTGIFKTIFDKRQRAEHFIDIQPCFYDRARNWWIWVHRESKWKRVDETDILNAINRQADTNLVNSKEKTEMLEALRQVSRENEPEKVGPKWIQFRHDIFNVETGETFKASPKYFVTNPIPWNLHQEGFHLTPTMDKIFEQWVGPENVRKLYEIIAYCTMPDYPLHRIFCFIGAGMNGKSKFLELLKRFIGPENCCSTELDTLMNSRFEVTRLHKKLVCLMGETNFNEMSKTSMLKKLSGGDLIGFEYKNKDLFEETNYAKLLIATNNLPSTNDKTIGFYRRWMIIDFPNQFSEKRDILDDIPEEEYEALAVKSTMVLKDLLDARAFTNEGSVEERMTMYESKSNFLQKFVEEFTTEKLGAFITKKDFFTKFTDWCKTNRHRTMFEKTLSQGLKKLGWESRKRTMPFRSDDGREIRAMAWEDVAWKE